MRLYKYTRFWKYGIAAVCLLLLLVGLVHYAKKPASLSAEQPLIIPTVSTSVHPAPSMQAVSSLPWHAIEINDGDTLTAIFKKLGLSTADLFALLKNSQAKHALSQLRPGDQLKLQRTDQHHLIGLRYPLNAHEVLYAHKNANGFDVTIEKQAYTTTLLFKQAIIKHSLSQAAEKIGLTRQQFTELKGIFDNEIDFRHDIHPGDRFSILYREEYIKGAPVHSGDIMAAVFKTKHHVYKAIRFTYPKNHTGHYTPSGHNVEPLFLHVPVKYTRISDYFSLHRMDPILHKIHPHLGIDYAAPRGTPIKSIGDGVVIHCGKKGGYGNAVVVRYNRKYKALYGHMRNFAKGLHKGSHVKKGQVIGYVGSTGWSTGPHLHFEVYVYGIPRNPLTMKWPNNKSVPKSYLSKFHHHAKQLLHTLKAYQQAANNNLHYKLQHITG